MPSHCSFRLNLHELWSKERAGVKWGIWLPTTNPWKLGVKWGPIWNVLYTVGKIFFRAINYYFCIFKTDLIWEIYEHPKFWDSKSPSFGIVRVLVLGLPFGSPREKWHLDVVPMERHKIYYKEGSGASSQRLWAVLSLCLRLFLLNLLHHFHSTCSNRPLFLVVQVDLILNSHLWICPNPIPKL